MKLDEAARNLLLALDMWSCWRPERVSKQIGILRAALAAPKVAPEPPPMCPVCGKARMAPFYGDDYSLLYWYCPLMLGGVDCECRVKPGEELKPKERAK